MPDNIYKHYNKYMDYLTEKYLKELSKIRDHKTVETKRYLLSHLYKKYGYPVDLNRTRLIELYEYLQSQGLKESTIQRVLWEIRSLYRWLNRLGYEILFDRETLEDIYRSRRKQEAVKKKKRYFSDQELELILRAIKGQIKGINAKPPIYYLLVTFLTCSGLRISEATSVVKRDVSIRKVLSENGDETEIWKVYVRKGKFGKEREAVIYFFRPEWRDLWKEWLSTLKPENPIFTYTIKFPRGSTKTFTLNRFTAKQFFWKLEKQLQNLGYDIEINAHKFRRTYITKLATKGVPVNLVSEWVGHSRISDTMDIYMEAEKEKETEVVLMKLRS